MYFLAVNYTVLVVRLSIVKYLYLLYNKNKVVLLTLVRLRR